MSEWELFAAQIQKKTKIQKPTYAVSPTNVLFLKKLQKHKKAKQNNAATIPSLPAQPCTVHAKMSYVHPSMHGRKNPFSAHEAQTIDLHALTEQQATQYLFAQIENYRQQGKRTFCIVHGKGNETSILKGMVFAWITHETKHQNRILFARSIVDTKGESGAIFVYMRKHTP